MGSRANRPKHVNDEPNHSEASEVSSMFPHEVNLSEGQISP